MRLLSFPQIVYTIKLSLNEGFKINAAVQNIWYHFKGSSLITFLHMFWVTFQISQRIAGFRSSRWFGLGHTFFLWDICTGPVLIRGMQWPNAVRPERNEFMAQWLQQNWELSRLSWRRQRFSVFTYILKWQL